MTALECSKTVLDNFYAEYVETSKIEFDDNDLVLINAIDLGHVAIVEFDSDLMIYNLQQRALESIIWLYDRKTLRSKLMEITKEFAKMGII